MTDFEATKMWELQDACIKKDARIAELEREVAALRAALRTLRIDANRLAGRNLGGTYEDDVRVAIIASDAVLADTEAVANRFVDVDGEEMRTLICDVWEQGALDHDTGTAAMALPGILERFKARRGGK